MLNRTQPNASQSIVGFVRESVSSWFQPNPMKRTESPCEFARKNKIRCFRSRKYPNGDVRVSIITCDGKEQYAVQRNFTLAYIRLVNNFYASSAA